MGRALVAGEPVGMGARLAAIASGSASDPGVALTRLDDGVHVLAVLGREAASAAAWGAGAAVRWRLSDRQRQVLERVAAGSTNRSIADELGCSVGTIDLHVSALLERAGAESRAELVARFWTGS